MGTHDPLPEAWADEPRELLSIERDREPPAVTVHTQCTCELRPRERAAARAVVVDRDRRSEQCVDLRGGAAGSGRADRRTDRRERRVDDEVTLDEALQKRCAVEPSPDARGRRHRSPAVDSNGRRHGGPSCARDLREHVARHARALHGRRDDGSPLDDEGAPASGRERARRRRLRVDRDEPAAGHVVAVAVGVNRHALRAPTADRRDDLGTALPADVDPEHVHAWLGVAVELQGPHGGRADRDRDDEPGEDPAAVHHGQ